MKIPPTSQMLSLTLVNYGVVQIQWGRAPLVRVQWQRVHQEDYNNEKIEVRTQ